MVGPARVDHDQVWLTCRGRRVAVVVDAEDLAHLHQAAEDLADITGASDARGNRPARATPRPSGAKKLVGGDGERRVRTGDFRIVDEIHDQILLVLLVLVALVALVVRRREIYR